MYRKIIILAASFLILSAVLSSAQNPMQGGQGRAPMGDMGQNLSKESQELVSEELSAATTAENVKERYRRLIRIISGMIRSGRPVDAILPRDEGERIETLMKEGNLREAASKVHEVILRLKTAGVGTGDRIQETENLRLKTRDTRLKAQDKDARHDADSSVPVIHLDIRQMVNRNSFGNILKLMNPVIDQDNRRLYLSGTKSTSIGVIDLDKDELIETFDIGTPGGFLLLDPKTKDLYLFVIGVDIFNKIDLKDKSTKRVFLLPPYLSLPKKGSPEVYRGYAYKDTGYPFKVGYLQNENAAYGIIEVRDSSGKIVDKIKHGPNALYFAIDPKTGKLYATNSGDGSITVFDLNSQNRKVKDIDVGDSVDEIVLNPKLGGIYIRNRLGGSEIYCYNPTAMSLDIIPNENTDSKGLGMWPTQMVYDEGKLYVLSHYSGGIDVVDTATNKVVSRIPLSLSYKPRTDALSYMVMDKTRKLLYAVFPELGELAIANAKDMKHVKTLKVAETAPPMDGPALIMLAVDEKRNLLYIYLSAQGTLNLYSGDTYRLEKTISVYAKRTERIMTSNPEKGLLYIGNQILDADTLEKKGSFPRGDKVISFNNSDNKVYLTEAIPLGPAKMVEKVYEYEDSSLKKEWQLTPIISIPSSFAFDFSNNKFYVGYFEAAVIEAFDLSAGKSPTGESPAPPPPLREGFKQKPMNAGKGRCGDGICQPIEKETGRCPEDCR